MKSDSKEKEELPVAQAKEIPNSQAPVNNVGRPSSAAEANHQQQQDNSAAAAAAANANEVANNSNAHTFTFRELASATKNFRQECLLGESGFGKVYRGTLQATGQVVAVKQLDRHGTKANKEFLVEVMMLSLLHHPNLVDLIGYCADGEQRLLVYEYMPKGSLKDHLLETKPDTKPLDWLTRMKIASGTAQAVEYLHDKANPPVIYRNLKSSNILLDENFEPKLTDYGLVKLELDSGNNHQRMVNINGCCAPEYERNGELTPKSDVYSFGVILLELITGRRALDTSLPNDQQNLVTWAQPYFRDPKRFPELADPKMNGAFPERSLNQAVGVAAMCLQEEPFVRPLIADVVAALSFLTVPLPEGSSTPPPAAAPAPPQKTSSSSSESEKEPAAKQKLEAAPSHKDQKEGSSSDDEDAESDSESHNQSGKFNEDGGSSSESLYNEDDYSDAESEQEDTGNVSMRKNSRAKSRAKSRASSKRKVMFEIDNEGTGRNSKKQSGKSFKTHSNSKGSSVSRKSSRRDSKKIKSNSSKKSKDESEDDASSTDSDNKSSKRNNSSKMGSSNSRRKSMGKSNSRGYSESDVESDESASHRRSFSSTSKFSLDSRGSSNYEGSEHGSSSRHENIEE